MARIESGKRGPAVMVAMRSITRCFSVAICLLIAMCGCTDSLSLSSPTTPIPLLGDRYILVMLNEIPSRHFRPDDAYGANYKPAAHAVGAVARTIENVNREFGLTRLEDWPMPALGVRCFLEVVSHDQSVSDVLLRLSADARVESAEAVNHYHTLARNDAYYELQASAKALRLDQLHAMATGRAVRIAQIDSGVELNHPDLAGQIVDAPNLVDARIDTLYEASEAHGTEVAGIIVAKADNGIGIVGIAPNATLLALRACWQVSAQEDAANCNSFTLAKAVQYAMLHHVQVLNMSLAGPPDRLLTRLLEQAHAQGIHIVCATDPDAAPALGFPASLPFVISVSSEPNSLRQPSAVVAPGARVLTTTPRGSWGFVSGNSFAVAHVSGVIALLLEVSPRLNPSDVRRMLEAHSRPAQRTSDLSALDACGLLSEQMHRSACSCCQQFSHQSSSASAAGS